EREVLIAEILEHIETYSSQLNFIHIVGYQEGVGHKLVTENFDEKIHTDFIERVKKVPPTEPEREWDAWRIYDAIQSPTGNTPLALSDDPVLLRAVLRSVKSVARSQSMGSRQVKVEGRLAWGPLVEVFGSEDAVKNIVSKVRRELGD